MLQLFRQCVWGGAVRIWHLFPRGVREWLVISTMAVAVTVTGDYYLVGSLVLPLYLSG